MVAVPDGQALPQTSNVHDCCVVKQLPQAAGQKLCGSEQVCADACDAAPIISPKITARMNAGRRRAATTVAPLIEEPSGPGMREL
jgi:hypothetical protein